MTAPVRPSIQEWWPKLADDIRAQIVHDLDTAPLTEEAVVAIAQARGVGPTAAGFVNADTDALERFFLRSEDYDWVRDNFSKARDDRAFDNAFPYDPGAVDRAIPRDDDAFNRAFPPSEDDIRTMRF